MFGRERVWQRAAMTAPKPRTDRELEILSTSKRSTGTENSSAVTWKGGDLVVWLLRTYCVSPAGRYQGNSDVSCRLVQGLQRATCS